MLGLLAHGLHLLLVVLGLAGVTALLAPQLRRSPFLRGGSGVPTYRPPASVAEHEERVAALRTAARNGQLTTAPLVAPTRAWAGAERDGSLWRAVGVSSSAAAAFIHAALFPHHLQEGLLLGVFFFVSALGQAAWAYLAAREVTRDLLLVGLYGNLAFIALWAVTRTVGLPFGLLPGPEGVGAWDVCCVVWEWAVVLTCAVGLHADERRWGLALGGLGRHALLFLSVSVVVLAVLSLAVSHE